MWLSCRLDRTWSMQIEDPCIAGLAHEIDVDRLDDTVVMYKGLDRAQRT